MQQAGGSELHCLERSYKAELVETKPKTSLQDSAMAALFDFGKCSNLPTVNTTYPRPTWN